MVAGAEGTWPLRAGSGPRDCGHLGQGVGKWCVHVFQRARRKPDGACVVSTPETEGVPPTSWLSKPRHRGDAGG